MESLSKKLLFTFAATLKQNSLTWALEKKLKISSVVWKNHNVKGGEIMTQADAGNHCIRKWASAQNSKRARLLVVKTK